MQYNMVAIRRVMGTKVRRIAKRGNVTRIVAEAKPEEKSPSEMSDDELLDALEQTIHSGDPMTDRHFLSWVVGREFELADVALMVRYFDGLDASGKAAMIEKGWPTLYEIAVVQGRAVQCATL